MGLKCCTLYLHVLSSMQYVPNTAVMGNLETAPSSRDLIIKPRANCHKYESVRGFSQLSQTVL